MKIYPRYISFHLRYNNNKDHFLSTQLQYTDETLCPFSHNWKHRPGVAATTTCTPRVSPAARGSLEGISLPSRPATTRTPFRRVWRNYEARSLIVVCEFPGGSEHQSACGGTSSGVIPRREIQRTMGAVVPIQK